jgi:predicted ester cyclase
MATDNKALVRRIFEEIINQRREDAIDELFDENFVDHGPGGQDLHGREEFRTTIKAWLAAFPDVHCEVSHLVEEGDRVGWVVHTTGTHTGDALGFPATGKRIDTLSANIGVVRGGKAVEHWSEQGMLAMLQQLGVIPPMGRSQPSS